MSTAPVPDGLAAEVDRVGEDTLRADPYLALLAAAVAVRAWRDRTLVRFCQALGQAVEQLGPGQQ